MPPNTQTAQSTRYNMRVALIAIAFTCVFLLALTRLYIIQIIEGARFKKEAQNQQHATIVLPPWRGDIIDRNGIALSASALLDAIYVDKRNFNDDEYEITRALAKALARTRRDLARDLGPKTTRVESDISPERSARILDRVKEANPRYGAVFAVTECRRMYPKGSLAAHLLGFCLADSANHENKGIAGLELIYDDLLKGTPQKVTVRVNRWRQSTEPVDEDILYASKGNSIELTIDSRIQHFAEQALAQRVEELEALGGACLVMNPKTGEILAAASYPSFIPDDPAGRFPNNIRHRVFEDALEPGSVMKIFTYAIAIEKGLIDPRATIDCTPNYTYKGYRFTEGKLARTVTDFHKLGEVTVKAAFAESSNIGATKIGLLIPPMEFRNQLLNLGIAERTGLWGNAEAHGKLTSAAKWSFWTQTSVPYGYEIQANSVQLLACVSAIANNGVKMKPQLLRRVISPRGEIIQEFKPKTDSRVFSANTCRIISGFMEEVVENGTGETTRMDSYRIAAKTGTAKKHDKETKRYVASIVGFLPVSDPQLAIYCWIDEPIVDNRYFYTGGGGAGPVFRKVAEASVLLLGIRPDKFDIMSGATVADSGLELDASAEAETRRTARGGFGQMPDLTGLTKLEAHEAIGKARRKAGLKALKTHFQGSGVVVGQDPPPGSILDRVAQCSVRFSSVQQDAFWD